MVDLLILMAVTASQLLVQHEIIRVFLGFCGRPME